MKIIVIEHFYGQKLLVFLLAVTVICLGYLSFDNAEYFDRLFEVVIFVFFVFYTRTLKKYEFKNINTVGILAILFAERFIEEIAYYSDAWAVQEGFIYICAGIIFYKLKYDSLIKYVYFPVTLAAVFSSLYWYFRGYDAPNIHYYIALLLLNILVRHFFMMRVFIIKRLTSYKSIDKNICILPVDRNFMTVAKVNAFLNVAMIIEYLIRHLFYLNIDYVYNYYPVTAYIISIISLFLIVEHLFNKTYLLTA